MISYRTLPPLLSSGATLDRDRLQRALRNARAGLYDVLLIYRIDRLTRSIRGVLDIVDILNDAGVALVHQPLS